MLAAQVEPVKQRDWEAKRRENDLKDVAQAGSKMGVKREVIEVRRMASILQPQPFKQCPQRWGHSRSLEKSGCVSLKNPCLKVAGVTASALLITGSWTPLGQRVPRRGFCCLRVL